MSTFITTQPIHIPCRRRSSCWLDHPAAAAWRTWTPIAGGAKATTVFQRARGSWAAALIPASKQAGGILPRRSYMDDVEDCECGASEGLRSPLSRALWRGDRSNSFSRRASGGTKLKLSSAPRHKRARDQLALHRRCREVWTLVQAPASFLIKVASR
jgi:hypothetical protein